MKINFKHLFDWTVEEVEGPAEMQPLNYKGVIVSYAVITVYKHHGACLTYFTSMHSAEEYVRAERKKMQKKAAQKLSRGK